MQFKSEEAKEAAMFNGLELKPENVNISRFRTFLYFKNILWTKKMY